MKVEQPEARQELIKLFKQSKGFASYVSKNGWPNEELLEATALCAIWCAAKDLDFDSTRVMKSYRHLAEIAGFVGYIKVVNAAPQVLSATDDANTFLLLDGYGGRIQCEQFDPDGTPHSYKLKHINNKDYLILKWDVTATTMDENEYEVTQYVRIENAKFKIEKTKRKVIP